MKKNKNSILAFVSFFLVFVFSNLCVSFAYPIKAESVSSEIIKSQCKDSSNSSLVEARPNPGANNTYTYADYGYEKQILSHDFFTRLHLFYRLFEKSNPAPLQAFAFLVGQNKINTFAFSPLNLKTYDSSAYSEGDILSRVGLSVLASNGENVFSQKNELVVSESLANQILAFTNLKSYSDLFNFPIIFAENGDAYCISAIVHSNKNDYETLFQNFIFCSPSSSLVETHPKCLSIVTDGFFNSDVTLVNDLISLKSKSKNQMGVYFYNFSSSGLSLGRTQRVFEMPGGLQGANSVCGILFFPVHILLLLAYFRKRQAVPQLSLKSETSICLLSFVLSFLALWLFNFMIPDWVFSPFTSISTAYVFFIFSMLIIIRAKSSRS